MKKITLIIIIVSLCIYLSYQQDKYADVINEITNIPSAPTINDVYDKYWNINNTSYSLLPNRPVYNSSTKGKVTLDAGKLILDSTEPNNIENTLDTDKLNLKSTDQINVQNLKTTDNYKNTPPATFILNDNTYNLFGLASNKYYNQFYIVYERKYYDNDQPNEYYEYILVKLIYNKYKVQHVIQPRKKIYINEYVDFSLGSISLNPLYISKL